MTGCWAGQTWYSNPVTLQLYDVVFRLQIEAITECCLHSGAADHSSFRARGLKACRMHAAVLSVVACVQLVFTPCAWKLLWSEYRNCDFW